MDAGETRAGRRERTRGRNRLIVIGAIVAVLIVGGAVAAIALGGGSSSTSTSGATPTTQAHTTLTLTAGDVSVAGSGAPVAITPQQTQAVMSVIRDYVQTATIEPLRTGQPAGDLSGVFDSGTLARVDSVDRAVMTDEGLPKVTGNLVVTATPVPLVGLGDQQGNLVLISARLQLTVDGQVTGSRTGLTVQRQGDLVLASNGFGGWKVTSYSMSVNRAGAGVDTPATTAPAAATTKKVQR
jgi:hypothetical protein